MVKLQREIRLQREIERHRKSSSQDKYTKIFEPITKSITKSLNSNSNVPGHTQTPAETANLISIDDKKEEVEEPLVHIDELEDIEGPGELYTRALATIPQRLREDGMLGLDTVNHMIGDWTYDVIGNKLMVKNNEKTDDFDIDDYNLWCLLLVFNPQKINLATENAYGQLLPFVKEYAHIIKRLGLLTRYQGITKSQKRIKFKLLKRLRGGSGFMFTTHPPTFIHPDTVVIPSDPAGLMKDLYLSLAEFRAGNTSMRNIVVPLAAEAKRMGILPNNLLTNDEKTWVFA